MEERRPVSVQSDSSRQWCGALVTPRIYFFFCLRGGVALLPFLMNGIA